VEVQPAADVAPASAQEGREEAPQATGADAAGSAPPRARSFQTRSFSTVLGEEPCGKAAEQIHLSAWERFLAGQVACPCCSFCFFLAMMLLLSAGGLMGGFKIMESSGQVLSNDIVQLYYAQSFLQEKGCEPGEAFGAPECRPAAQNSSAPGPLQGSSVPRVRALSGEAIIILYEATGSGCPGEECDTASKNLLTPRNMAVMKAFEDTLWGAKDFQDNYCLLRYPAAGNATPLCNPPLSLLNQLYSGTTEAVTATKELFDTGFGGVFGECMCSTTAETCASCASPAARSQVVDCLMERPPSSIAFVPEPLRASNATLRTYFGQMVGQICAGLGNSSCQYSAPYLSPICSTTAWGQTDHGSQEPLQGSDLTQLLSRVCDRRDASLSPLRRNALPSFACEGGQLPQEGTPFLMSLWMTGQSGEDKDEITDAYAPKLWETYQAAAKKAMEDSDGEVRPMMFASFTALNSLESLLIHDCVLAVGSFLVVFLYMWLTTESFFLTSMGMLQVLLSCPPAFLLWKFISPDGVSQLQFLSIFMILGIGADDVFVLLDAWKQARVALDGSGTPPQVFAMAYRRAFSAMLTTTSTTCAAFIFGSFSEIPAVSSFCLFAGIVVIFDFLWCIAFFASSIPVYERFFMGKSCCCVGAPRAPGSCCGPGCCWGGLRALRSKTRCVAKPAEGQGVDERALERFCAGPLFRFVHRYRYALAILWVSVALVAAVLSGTILKTATKPADIGDEANDLVRFATVTRDYFTTQEQQVVQVGWGLPAEAPVSRFTSTSPITPEVALLPEGAKALTTEAGQQAALRLCKSADDEGTRCESEACLVFGSPGQCARQESLWSLRKTSVPDDPFCATGRYCFMEWVEEYVVHHLNASFPVAQAEFVPLLQSEGFRTYLEARRLANVEAGRHWDNTLGSTQTGWIVNDGKLAYAWMTFNATFKAQAPKDISNKWYERWEDHVGTQAGASAARQSSDMYVFMVLQNELLHAAIQGILTSLGVTAVILALVTFNWALALIGLLNIAVITVIFLGTMPLIPWELGSSECIFLIAVVGLAVDYTVHLLHSYNEQKGSREEKTQGALSNMGISVASGAITTVGASLMLFFCDLAFFQQYGAFIFIVITISFLVAFTNLPCLLLMLGPQGDFGQIRGLYSLHAWIRRSWGAAQVSSA